MYGRSTAMEKKIYILCHEENSNTILEAFDSTFGTDIANGGVNNGTLRNGDLAIQIISYGQDLGEDIKEFIGKQVNAVCGYVASIETVHVDIKINVLHQLMRSKGFVVLQYSYPGDEHQHTESMVLAPLLKVISKVNGLLLVDEGTTVLDKNSSIVLAENGNSQLEWFMPYERPVPADFFHGAACDSLRRRNENMEKILARHIHVTKWLPLIESEKDAHFRTREEIAGRAAALMIVALFSEYILAEHKSISEAKDFVQPIIDIYHANDFFSEKEKMYLENDNSTREEQIQFLWQYEPLMVILWALGYENELFFPDKICDVGALVRTMREHNSIDALVKDANPRSADELLYEADMIYCLDWACVDTRIHGLPAPAGMDSGVVMERHKALNWLIQGEDWDSVDIST